MLLETEGEAPRLGTTGAWSRGHVGKLSLLGQRTHPAVFGSGKTKQGADYSWLPRILNLVSKTPNLL